MGGWVSRSSALEARAWQQSSERPVTAPTNDEKSADTKPSATPARYRSIIERVHAPPGSAVAGTHEAAPAAHDVEKAV